MRFQSEMRAFVQGVIVAFFLSHFQPYNESFTNQARGRINRPLIFFKRNALRVVRIGTVGTLGLFYPSKVLMLGYTKMTYKISTNRIALLLVNVFQSVW